MFTLYVANVSTVPSVRLTLLSPPSLLHPCFPTGWEGTVKKLYHAWACDTFYMACLVCKPSLSKKSDPADSMSCHHGDSKLLQDSDITDINLNKNLPAPENEGVLISSAGWENEHMLNLSVRLHSYFFDLLFHHYSIFRLHMMSEIS